jgi:hypothetical protein
MTKKLQKMTPQSYRFQSYLNRSKTLPPISKKLPPFFGRIVEGRIEVGFNLVKKRKKMNTLPRAVPPVLYLRSILHGAVSPPPPYNSRSSASTTAPSASAAAHLLIVVFLSLMSAPLLPLRHQPSTMSLQPLLSSKQSLLQLNHHTLPLASCCRYPPLPPHTC